MDEFLNAHKRQKILELLDRGLVMLHLDPRHTRVVVPEHFKSQPVLRLNIAYGFNLPSLDIGVDDIYAVLSFDRRNFGCTIPWEALFAASLPQDAHEGVVWPTSLPAELDEAVLRAVLPMRADLDDLLEEGDESVSAPPPSSVVTDPTEPIGPGRPGRPGFAVIQGQAGLRADADDPTDAADPGDDDEPPPRRPMLKVVKS